MRPSLEHESVPDLFDLAVVDEARTIGIRGKDDAATAPLVTPVESADIVSVREPLFDRYQSAWAAYRKVHGERIGGDAGRPPSYKKAALDAADPALQFAALELQEAREAFLAEFAPKKDV